MISDVYKLNFRKYNNLPVTWTEHVFTFDEFERLNLEFDNIMKDLIPLSVHIEEYTFRSEYSKVKYMKITIFSLYLICWAYILIVSFKIELIYPILNILDKVEPFSGLVM
jgi:hypothetical protein